MSEAKLNLIKWLDPGTASPESLVEPFKKLSGLLLLGVKQQVAAFWIDRGFISAETKVGKHRHRQVLRTSIEEFCLKYVTAVELARSIGSSPRNVICLLGKQNILPVTGKDIDGGRQYLFLRMDAIAALKDLGPSLTC